MVYYFFLNLWQRNFNKGQTYKRIAHHHQNVGSGSIMRQNLVKSLKKQNQN